MAGKRQNYTAELGISAKASKKCANAEMRTCHDGGCQVLGARHVVTAGTLRSHHYQRVQY